MNESGDGDNSAPELRVKVAQPDGMVHSSYKRFSSYWEPIYDPASTPALFKRFDWSAHSVGARDSVCSSDDLRPLIVGERHRIPRSKFERCDFEGIFDSCKLAFDECVFVNCDFKDSVWVSAKFSNCVFERCSFSTAAFDSVQFIACEWIEIGISSGEMKLSDVLISNPEKFIRSGYTNLDKDVLAQKSKTPEYQRYRLERTKANVARTVLSNMQTQHDDSGYYRAVKAYTKQAVFSRVAEAMYDRGLSRRPLKIFHLSREILARTELVILVLSGLVNAWGYSISRAAVCGLFAALLFCMAYFFLGEGGLMECFLRSAETMLLFGFTKYSDVAQGAGMQWLMFLNGCAGLWWYAIMVPTIVNRISRVRG